MKTVQVASRLTINVLNSIDVKHSLILKDDLWLTFDRRRPLPWFVSIDSPMTNDAWCSSILVSKEFPSQALELSCVFTARCVYFSSLMATSESFRDFEEIPFRSWSFRDVNQTESESIMRKALPRVWYSGRAWPVILYHEPPTFPDGTTGNLVNDPQGVDQERCRVTESRDYI